VFVELLRIGQATRAAPGDAGAPTLLGELAAFYCDRRGEVVQAAVRREDGTVVEQDDPADIADLVSADAGHVVLRLAGLCVADLFDGEQGCHVHTSLLSGSEVVRVRAMPAPHDRSCRAVLQEHARAARAFERALTAGDEAPPDPSALLPAVRAIRFDPPERPGESVPIEVEDYALGHVEAGRGRRMTDLLPRLWWLRLSRRSS